MARKKVKQQAAWEWRLLRWIFVLVFLRLPMAFLRACVWLIRSIIGPFRQRHGEQETADSFYRSYQWRRLRVDVLEANRQRYGLLACECCGMVDVGSFHVDHIYPRSTHPELALDPANLQVLCDDCNIGKGTTYTTNWRGGEDPSLPKRRGLSRFFARS